MAVCRVAANVVPRSKAYYLSHRCSDQDREVLSVAVQTLIVRYRENKKRVLEWLDDFVMTFKRPTPKTGQQSGE